MKYNKYGSKIEKAIQFVRERFPFEGYMYSGKGITFDIARIVLNYLQPKSKIIDFGCGPCDKIAVLQKLGFICYGYDDLQDHWHKIPGNREKIFAFAKDFGIKLEVANNDFSCYEKNYFDMLMMNGVLEHLHNSPRDILNDLLELVKPRGFFFVIVPNAVNIRKRIDVMVGRTNLPRFDGYYWYPGPWRGHIREYTKGDLVKLVKYLNLEVLELKSCNYMLSKLPYIIQPAYVAITKIFTGWRDSWVLVAKKKPNWKPRKILPEDELVKILGRYTSYKY